ncbi:hypothetical protein C7999DRAFT_44849 [Corynascus novoguineensis]|uniref:Kinesin light chain n=1 Tax=Corynascus novoguineensis TaxID=1126955 RepID=A0AAN7CJQ4_9PEZI|nr:hypothetical protein C7999DRAFT_44849 [Corynascus novoguineensis]
MNVNFHGDSSARRPVYRLFPFPRNEDVVNRHSLFAELDQLLPLSEASQSAALWGLGGSGKTQIALEYAYYRAEKDPTCSVFWVHADDETTFVSDYKTIAKILDIPNNLDGDELLMAVRDRTEAPEQYVLALDTADDLTVFTGKVARKLLDFVPRHSGTVLWTSRDMRIGGSLVSAKRAINVARMTNNEAMELLEIVGGLKISEVERADAAQLLAELDWLLLAVSQAAAYIRRMSTTLSAYLSRLAIHRERQEVLGESEFDRYRRPGLSNSILETWDISTEQLRRENKMAYNILHVLAFLDNQNIPLDIMIKAAALCTEVTDDRQGNETTSAVSSRTYSKDNNEEVFHAVTRLQEFSFLHFRASEGTSRAYEMHKLAQEATRYALRSRNRHRDEVYFSKLALPVVIDLFPEGERELWRESRVSSYLYDRGRWREKEPVDRKTYESIAELATTYHGQGRYREAEKIKIEVLFLRRGVFGEEHPNTLQSMADLAATYRAQGRYGKAEKIKVEVLALRRDILGEKHPDTIQNMADLATTYHGQGKYKEAEKFCIGVLALQRDVLGEKHPETMRSMADLATIYHTQRKYGEKINMEMLSLRRNVLREKYPDAIQSMADLAATYHAQGRYEEEKIFVEVLAQRREVLGDKHPETLLAMHDLANTWNDRQRRVEALL